MFIEYLILALGVGAIVALNFNIEWWKKEAESFAARLAQEREVNELYNKHVAAALGNDNRRDLLNFAKEVKQELDEARAAADQPTTVMDQPTTVRDGSKL